MCSVRVFGILNPPLSAKKIERARIVADVQLARTRGRLAIAWPTVSPTVTAMNLFAHEEFALLSSVARNRVVDEPR